MVKALVLLSIFIILFFPSRALAVSKPHYTLIINQVRGGECCDKGSIENLKNQLDFLNQLELPANFALRYDALVDPNYKSLFGNKNNHLAGGLLEISSSLAQAAGVQYKGDEDSWYEAQNIFLIGYRQEERKKLIDTYMEEFYQNFKKYPKFTAAWMIDAWSLRYLKQRYGVELHQLTREQFGTDSYTLYGGLVHYPYWPSENWVLIPAKQNLSMPLIVRQTIMDPVFSYGDNSDSYTSQPNDYLLRGANIDYFKHLFLQAHNQKQEFTFALVGLENSMEEKFQKEYLEQLKFVKDWVQQDKNNIVVLPPELVNFYKTQGGSISAYGGKSQKDPNEQAFWVNTNNYRARVRLSGGKLFISDLRLYSSNFTDPYLDKPAGLLGWWIVPFVLDGSRYFVQGDNKLIQNLQNDFLKNRLEKYSKPVNVLIADDVKLEEFKVEQNRDSVKFFIKGSEAANFDEEKFSLGKSDFQIENQAADALRDLQYFSQSGQALWGFEKLGNTYFPFVDVDSLEEERMSRSALLFPQLEDKSLSTDLTELYVNNKYAIANRNPIRLVLFPRDENGNPVLLRTKPTIASSKALESIGIIKPNSANGMIFIDLDNRNPLKTEISVNVGDFTSLTKIYFAPDCKKTLLNCIIHPMQTWWYIRAKFDDWQREKAQQKAMEEKFFD